MSNPAPTSSISERATSPTNRRLRALVRRCPSPLRPPSFNALVTSSFEAWSAGGEEEIGHVRAGNQEHESDGAEEREEGWFYLANEPFVEGRKKHVPTLVRLVKLLGELRIDGAETSLRLLQIDTAIQTRDRRPRAVVARFVPEIDCGWHPNLGLLRVFKPRRHHADDREGG